MQPLDAFRTPDPAVKPQGDLFAGIVTRALTRPRDTLHRHVQVLGGVPVTDDLMVYLTYAEGFTEAGEPVVTIGPNSVVPRRRHARRRHARADPAAGRGHR